MAYTIPQIIDIAKVSGYLANDAVAKGVLWGRKLDPMLGIKLYVIRKDVEDVYNLDPNYAGLVETSNYLLSLCNPIAASLVVGGGNSVTPSLPVNNNIYPFIITSANFKPDGISYDNNMITSDNLTLFINQYSQQWLTAASDTFSYTSTGIIININSFNANTQSWTIMIQKLNS